MRRIHILALTLLLLPLVFVATPKGSVIEGVVVDFQGPVPFATVRSQGQADCTRTDAAGKFNLRRRENATRVTAAKPGYRIGWTPSNRHPIQIRLAPLPSEDNFDYTWIDPVRDSKKPNNCGNCHGAIEREWAGSGHARSAVNPRVLTLFGGTESPLGKDWNLLEQHPLGAGVCASCHAPTMSSPTLDYDLRSVNGVAARGVHCDYCHKIADAPTDKLGTRFGRDGYELLRPHGDEQLFFGPLPDAVRPGDAFVYAPFYKESRYCASCHEGVIFGVHVYGTYTEWLQSPAAKAGTQCQDCHMTPTGAMTNVAPGHGGIERAPKTLASHDFPGGSLAMLKKCLRLEVRIRTEGNRTQVEMTLTADNVGHRVPTGFFDRNLVMVVEATDEAGRTVDAHDGPRLPAFAGANVAGQAGVLYAKTLTDDAGRTPLPFWLPYETMTDTRLHPGQPDRRTFTFPVVTKLRVRLLYRHLWPTVAERIASQDNELVILDQDLTAK
ncbi:MAG: hypothetical protein HY040_25365 [Planctomycetes bacterium]|nr:hypothetical protein [Planctomycetota bacterium]